MAALHEVFGEVRDHVIQLGSIKGNIGHANRAAGTAGLIKAVLARHYRVLPPTIGHDRPAPALRLAEGPFTVTTKPVRLGTGGAPVRAGVSSLGFGDTNAHVVLEQAPSRPLPRRYPGGCISSGSPPPAATKWSRWPPKSCRPPGKPPGYRGA